MQTIWHDLRYAFRQLRRSPGFSLTVVLTLALGVAANAVVFGVLDALVLRPLPVPQAGQLVSLNRAGSSVEGGGSSSPGQSYPDYRDLRDNNRTFSGLAAYAITRAGVRIAGSVESSYFYEASENYFDVLGIQPTLGRFFHASDARGPNGSPYLVLSNSYWQRRFHSDSKVIGQVIEVDKHPFTILGVAPASFRGTELFFAADFWLPMLNQEQVEGYSYLERRYDHQIWAIGRLKPGVTSAQAEVDLNLLAKQMSAKSPADEGLRFHLSRPGLLGDMLGGPARAFLFGIMGLATLVLLAACANLGSLFAARAADRARELAVRLALGARRATLVRQLLTEAVLVSLFGGVLGLILAAIAAQALTQWRPTPDLPIQFAVPADASVGALALALSLFSGIFFGLVPLRQVWRSDAYQVIRSGAALRASSRRWSLRDLLLLVQIALCSVLLTASLVAVRGLGRTLHASFGFQPEGAVLATYDAAMSAHNAEQALALDRRAIESIARLPGVSAVGFTSKAPLSLSSSDNSVYRDGTTDFRNANIAADANYFNISPDYFAAAGTHLLAGRDFTWHDDEHAPRVAIINQLLAHKLFGAANPLEKYFIDGMTRTQVIGVVEDGKYNTVTEDPTPALFVPMAQGPDTGAVFVVRSRAGEAATAAAIQSIFQQLDPDLPVAIGPWSRTLGILLLPSVVATVALGVMGVLAAMLAVTGIFGMASYAVSKRMRELGLRVALGASRRQVLAAALGRPARLLLAGSAAGLFVGVLASRLLAHVVYQATSQDPVVLAGVVGSMVLLALAATWLPARRILQVDPALLLREE